MTVEEVATLAIRSGWSYEALMAMSGAERRLWLAAFERTGGTRPGAARPDAVGAAAAGRGTGPAAPGATVAPAGQAEPPSAWSGVGPLATEAERRARLLALHEELNHRGRRDR